MKTWRLPSVRMEVASSAPWRPLAQERRANVPNHLLESRIFAKVKSNSLIQAEPSELHFSGFELGKHYLKSLILINISSDVMNIHITPTQSRHFQTTCIKKHRLIPGLAHTVTVHFCPDEWRHFYDCVRVHCKGEENLLIPVHAYPVIDDLHIPLYIDLPAVPLGQSVILIIPLRCSCPVDVEFQVYVLQPHEAFSIHPLTGVIPAQGQVEIFVTFSPLKRDTYQVTIQLVVSQFNSKPYLCTITAPDLVLSPGGASSAGSSLKVVNLTWEGLMMRAHTGLTPLEDVCTPAGVAKMLIRDANKLSSKHLREVASSGGTVRTRQEKEALFISKVQRHVKEEQANLLRWQVHLGKEPLSDDTRRRIVEEREIARREYTVQRGDAREEEVLASGQPRPSTGELCEAGQVVTRRRLSGLEKLSQDIRSPPTAQREEKTCDAAISPDRVFPSSVPVFSDDGDDLLAESNLVPVPVDPIDVTVTARVPLLKLEVPQHYKLMGYQPASAWEAYNSYIPTTLARPLRTEAPVTTGESEAGEEQDDEEEVDVGYSFSIPDALLRPIPAHPLRIFNPAPGLQPHKPTPKYLEGDLEFHLCPLLRYKTSEITETTHKHTQRTFLDREDGIKGVMTWKNFDSIAWNCLSKQPARSGGAALRRSVDYDADILPLLAPRPFTELPAELAALMDRQCDVSGVKLTPQMIRAEFLAGDTLLSNLATGRHQREAT